MLPKEDAFRNQMSAIRTGLCVLVVGTSALRLPIGSTPRRAAAPAPASALPVAAPSDSFASWYRTISTEHYLAIACTQSGLLRSGADLAAQTMRGEALDFCHAGAMFTIGFAVSGLIGATWLQVLEGRVGSGTCSTSVVKKAAADYVLYAPFANSMYLFCVPALTALYASAPMLCAGTACYTDVIAAATVAATGAWEHGFSSAMLLELSMFTPYNLLSFRMIPFAFRPQTTACMCAAYTVGLSSLC